ncbi:hypothetical protein [Bacteroides sp.]|uniref:hypothetical protein n=1 Tax=Bacteroides sp. TaxID=29523 RepID=UPI0025C28D3C|nr:hypothetical protein [Bacteroides sp.]
MNEISKKKRGGARQGSGRKKTTCKTYGFNAPEEVCMILEQLDNKTDFICEAIVKLAKEKGIVVKEETAE